MASLNRPTTNAVPTPPKFVSNLGTDMITIVFGEGESEKKFSIHQNLLSQKATQFAKTLHTLSLNHESRRALLPEEELAPFEHFVGWLYQCTSSIDAGTTSKSEDCIREIAFAEKYKIHEFADNVMDGWIRRLSTKNLFPKTSIIPLAYKITAKNSKLRIFSSKSLVYPTITFTSDEVWPTEALFDAAKENDDLLLDMFHLLRGQSGKNFPDPRKAPPCDYHQHSKDKACPYISK